ncbi:MAG: D-alanyl-D-alanine carboxypeptidase [Sphingomonadales bacterium]|nr:MAG: D-alanyl-D-alanine carboxypeptidase [Sphingomonadales bacterium]
MASRLRSGFALLAAAYAALLISLPAHAQTPGDRFVPPPADEIPIAMLVDLSSGQILHSRNADRRFMPASITKAMTTYLAFELVEEGRLQFGQRVTFSRNAFRDWHRQGSTMFLGEGDQVTVAQLLRGITTVSANDASVALAEGAAGSLPNWIALMNAKAREIGMTNSHFGSPNGFPDEGHTFVTARDLVRLGQALVQDHPQLYAQFIGHREYTYGGITQSNHDPLIGEVRGADGIKTGFTNEAGYGYLGSASRNGRRLVMVVAGADRARTRNRAARNYIEWGFRAFETRHLFGIDDEIGVARVQGGSARNVALIAERPISATFPRGAEPAIEMTVHYVGPLRAPITAGEQIAELEISVAGMEPSRIPLVARDSVEQAGFFARLVNGVTGWLQ